MRLARRCAEIPAMLFWARDKVISGRIHAGPGAIRYRLANLMALKKLGYLVQGVLAFPLYALLLLMSLNAASRLSSWLFRSLGGHSSLSRRARRQLTWALPDLTEGRVAAIVSGMWDNIGYICAEYIHLPKLMEQGQPAELAGG